MNNFQIKTSSMLGTSTPSTMGTQSMWLNNPNWCIGKIIMALYLVLYSSLAFSQNWTLNGTSIYYNSGNVGIGMTTPEAGLHVHSSTPILSTGPGAGFRFRDLKAGATVDDDWTFYSNNGYLRLKKGNQALEKFQIASDGTVTVYKNLLTNGFFYGQGDLRLFGKEGEMISGTVSIRGLSLGSGTNINLQLSTQANGQQVDVMRLNSNGNVGIGTTDPGSYKLAVEGKIGAREVEVKTGSWADFVFRPDYRLRPLTEVATYVQLHHHLPEIPSEAEAVANGIGLGEMNVKLLQKIEELTLYLIEQQNRIERLEKKFQTKSMQTSNVSQD